MASPTTASAQLVAVARGPDGTWHFAYQNAAHLAYGPLGLDDVGLPRLRDLAAHLPGRIFGTTLVVTVPVTTGARLEQYITSSSLFAGARIHVYPVGAADIAAALGLRAPGDVEPANTTPSVEDLRRALIERLPAIGTTAMEGGALTAVAMMVAGVEAHKAWLARFGHQALS